MSEKERDIPINSTNNLAGLKPLCGADLEPEDEGLLNSSIFHSIEERRQIFAQKRAKYASNPLALEQIDIYDPESPYRAQWRLFRDALKSGDAAAPERFAQWVEEHYPLFSEWSKSLKIAKG